MRLVELKEESEQISAILDRLKGEVRVVGFRETVKEIHQ